MCYYQRNLKRSGGFQFCSNDDTTVREIHKNKELNVGSGNVRPVQFKMSGASRKTYRLVVACTGEYSAAAAGSSAPSKALSLSAIVTSVNRVNGCLLYTSRCV